MKQLYLLLCLLALATIQGQTQDTLYVWKAGQLVIKQSIKTADMDSITFKRPTNPTGINIAGPNITDIDGNTYQSVTNCGLTFTKQNLNVSKYSDGTLIPQVQDTETWAKLTTGAWCYYNNDPANGAVYGKLYNWYAVAGIHDTDPSTPNKKLAPTGWHVPSDVEWSSLINCLDPNADGGKTLPNIAGGKMKETSTANWNSPNTDATNSSGFTALPGGYRDNDGDGTFNLEGVGGSWWSSSEENDDDETYVWCCELDYDAGAASINLDLKDNGFSVRCLRD